MILQPISRFLILIALSAAQMASRDAAVSSALAELEKGRVLESIEQFKEILRANPADGPSYFYLSTLYTQMNEYGVAERYLKRAMELNPKQGAHYYQLGLIRYRQKQWVAALDLFKQALELGSGNNEVARVEEYRRSPVGIVRSRCGASSLYRSVTHSTAAMR